MEYKPTTKEEEAFLKNYDPSAYERPSVAVDIVIFTISRGALHVLMAKRTEFPYKGCWALPGGFVGITEQAEDTVSRKLKEKTGLEDIPSHQLATFSRVDRDPRMRVISIAYMAFVPESRLKGTPDLMLFEVRNGSGGLGFISKDTVFGRERVAFDHEEIIATALNRLRSRITYTDDALDFVDRNSFKIFELKKVYDAVLGKVEDASNFNRFFKNRYIKTGRVEAVGRQQDNGSGRKAVIYREKEKI